MKTKKNALIAALLAAGLMTVAGHAAAIEEMNFGLGAIGGSGPTLVNAKFLDLGFPASGVAPSNVLFGENALGGGSAGLFDIAVLFGPGDLGPSGTFNSKLVFHYDGAPGSDENLDLSDFDFGNGTGHKAAALLSGSASGTVIAAVPEPGTCAMLGVGLAAPGFVARRGKAGS